MVSNRGETPMMAWPKRRAARGARDVIRSSALGLDEAARRERWHSTSMCAETVLGVAAARALGVSMYPSLVLRRGEQKEVALASTCESQVASVAIAPHAGPDGLRTKNHA